MNHDPKNGPRIIISEETRTSFSFVPFSRPLYFSKPLKNSDYIQRSLQNGQLEQLIETLRSLPWPNGIHLIAVKRALTVGHKIESSIVLFLRRTSAR